MAQVVSGLRASAPAEAAQGLGELAGALALAGEQGLAALAERLRCRILDAGDMDGHDAALLSECAQRLRAELRQGLEQSLRGRALQAADLLPAWQALAGPGDVQDASPLLSLQVDECVELDLPFFAPEAAPVDPLAEAESALLGFLRAPDAIARREAAGTFARVLAGVAAAAGPLSTRRLWRVLQVYAEELAAGNFTEPTRTKSLLAHVLRALRHCTDAGLPAMLAPLARQALFELAQSVPLTAAGDQVARAFDLERQFSPSTDREAAGRPDALDAADEHFITQLGQWIAARESVADGLGPANALQALADSARRSARFAPLAEPLERLASRCSGSGVAGVDEPVSESVAAAMLCLHAWVAATSGASADAFGMADLLDLALDDPRAAKPALQARARLFEREPLMASLATACREVLDTGERLLEGAALQHDGALANADVRRLLVAMAGAARLLALDTVLPLAETLLEEIDGLPVDLAGDDRLQQDFAQTWVTLADDIAMLPWTAGWPEEPASGLARQDDQACLSVEDPVLPRQVADDVPVTNPLVAIFLDEAAGLLAQLRITLLPADGVALPAASADALHAAHTLAGCAVTVGVPAMGRLAQALESLLDESSPAAPPCHDPAAAREVLDTLEAMLAEYAETGTCRDADTLAARLRADASRSAPVEEDSAGIASVDAGAEVTVVATPDTAGDGAGHPMTDDAVVDAAEDITGLGGHPRVVLPEDDELLAIFREEAADLLPQLEQALHDWQQAPDDRAAPTLLLRILHTLKGSARMAGQLTWGDALHRCESEVGMISQLAPSAVGERLAALQVHVDEWRQAWCATPGAVLAASSAAPSAASPAVFDDPMHANADASGNAPLPEAAAIDAPSPAAPPAAPVVTARASSPSLLRVRAESFTIFADAVAELWVGHARLSDGVQQQRRAVAELADILARLRAQVRELEIDAESRIVSVAASSDDKGFDPLEFDRYTRLHEITRMIAESAADLADLQRGLMRQGDGLARAADAQVRELRGLQSGLQAVRSQAFGAIEARLRHVIRQAARESGREVECAIAGAAVEVERSLLDRLAGPLEHVLRNAVVHGIESPAERAAAGKPVAGRIVVSVASSAAELRLELADDGRGLDFDRIRDRASAVGLLAEQADPGPQALSDLIFQPGFSTASEVTALAGRGIGLDAVRSELQALGGRITVDSRAGEGCRFTICVPLSLATLPVLLVRAGRHRIGLPAAYLQQLLQLKPGDPGHDAGRRSLPWQGADVPVADLGHLLGEPRQPAAPDARVPVGVLRDSGRLLALRLDAVEGQRELVVKSPGPQLSRIPGLVGASVLGDGTIALIVDPFRLDANQPPLDRLLSASVLQPAGPLVLVVDDSLTVRRASQRLLERHGYEVALARDGIEALALLRERRPSAVLLDIEMPRMDGFELLAAVRDAPQLRTLPVVMITSRIADRHRQRAQQLGASAYMGKPFREEELVSLLAGLCRSTAGEQDEGRVEKQSRSQRSEAAA